MRNLFLKSVLPLAFVLITICRSEAQDLKTTRFGVIGGINISNLYSDNTTTHMSGGFDAGAFLRTPLANFVDLEPELYVSTKGATLIYNSLLVDGTANFLLTYVEMPFVCIFNVTPMVNLQIGPYVGYLVDGKVKNVANINLFNFEQNLQTDNFNRIDAGLVVGMGLDVKSVTMGLRYNLGLTKVGKDQNFFGSTYRIPDATNGVLNFFIAARL